MGAGAATLRLRLNGGMVSSGTSGGEDDLWPPVGRSSTYVLDNEICVSEAAGATSASANFSNFSTSCCPDDAFVTWS